MCRSVSRCCLRVYDMSRGHHGRVSWPRAVRIHCTVGRGRKKCEQLPRGWLDAQVRRSLHQQHMMSARDSTNRRSQLRLSQSISSTTRACVQFSTKLYIWLRTTLNQSGLATTALFLCISDRCMTMAELATFAEDNGDATDYTYGEDPNEGSTWDAHRIFG